MLYNNLFCKYNASLNNKTVAFLFAGDRLGHRHNDLDRYLINMNKFKSYLESKGYKIFLFIHATSDRWILKYIPFKNIVYLNNVSVETALNNYSKMDYVVSDRGHSQMLSFSVGCKTITPISHDKLKFFLEDIGLDKYGVEENDPNLAKKLINIFNRYESFNNYKIFYEKKMHHIIEDNKLLIDEIRRIIYNE
jgi:polysaccharide pyruvyl transferase WcaK-like protein